MKVCKNCMAQLPDEAVFCTQCGMAFEQETQNILEMEKTTLLSDNEDEFIPANEQLTALLSSDKETALLDEDTFRLSELPSSKQGVTVPQPISAEFAFPQEKADKYQKVALYSPNPQKFLEIADILKQFDVEIVSPSKEMIDDAQWEMSIHNSTREYLLFIANFICCDLKLPTIVDNCGLQIEAVTSANTGMDYNMDSFTSVNDILDAMYNVPRRHRQARLTNVLALISPTDDNHFSKEEFVIERIVDGKIALNAKGNSDCAYENIFAMNHKTLAQYSLIQKNELSQRYHILIEFKNKMKDLLQQ